MKPVAELDEYQREQLAVLLQEKARRQALDHWSKWQPHAKQQAFIEAVLKAEKYENWLFAANRAGKTDAGAWLTARFARFGIPGEKFRPTVGWVVSLDFPSSRDIVQPKLFNNGVALSKAPFIPDWEIKEWRVADQVLILKNGSVIGFKSADSGRRKFQGAERDYVWFDEEPPEEIYDEAVIRVASGSRLRIFGTCTLLPPEGAAGGVSWAYGRIIKPWMAGSDLVNVFQASIYDNPHLQKDELRRLEAIYPAGSVQRRIRLDGELLPGLSGARAYPGFDPRRNTAVLTDGPIPSWPLCWCWDFNVEPMVTLVGQRRQGVFYVYREFVLAEGNIAEMVDWFRSVYPAHPGGVLVYGDATGTARTSQTGISDYMMIQNLMRSYPSSVKLKIPFSNPSVRDRINAVNRACWTEDGEACLVIDRDQCPELLADLEQVLLDPRGKIKKTTDRRDPYSRRTHVSDALGYWIVAEAPVSWSPRDTWKSVVMPHAPRYAWQRAVL